MNRKTSRAIRKHGGAGKAMRPPYPGGPAWAGPMPDAAAAAGPRKIAFPVLLWVYSVVPLCVLVYLLDVFQFHGHLRDTLPRAPESYFALSLLFGTPHIVASNVIFLTNQEYLKAYWRRAVWMTLAIIAFFALGSAFLSYNVLFSIVATATILHVVKQQIGIGNRVAQLSGVIYHVWIWTLIGSSVAMYNGIFLQPALTADQLRWIDRALIAASFVLVATALGCQSRAKTPMGRRFLWANTIMIVTSFYFYFQQYYFFAILGPRIVHDGTAFIFYVVHDYNRHHQAPKNLLYRFFRKIRLNAYVAVPLVAIGLTLFLQHYADTYFAYATHILLDRTFPHAIAFGLVGYLGLMHYYMEAFTWKGASPYRKYISFAP